MQFYLYNVSRETIIHYILPFRVKHFLSISIYSLITIHLLFLIYFFKITTVLEWSKLLFGVNEWRLFCAVHVMFRSSWKWTST